MKNIYFTEVGFSFDGSVYLPYATGTIAAYAAHRQGFSDSYNIAGFIYKRKDTEKALSEFSNPYIAAFSCSIWNFEFNKTLAKKVKEKYPDCYIVFGGHNVSEENSLLESESYIDILMYGEGEITFAALLDALEKERLGDVDNISYRLNSSVVSTVRSYCSSLDDFPSPYLNGVFDNILKSDAETKFLSVLETNRGCPYSCAYCDWCSGKKVRLFPAEKVLAEIKWLADNEIEYCFCADSNFGMFERDVTFARALADSKEKFGYPKIFRPCYAKHSDNRIFEISSTLNQSGMDKGATMAYQSLSDTALHNINRQNLTLEHFSQLLKRYTSAGIPTYSELILGLPGETKESFCSGICKLLESGQHNSLSVYHCEMLPNSIMSQQSFVNKHKIKSIKVAFNHMHSKKTKEEVEEYSHIVQSTATLSKEDWVYCNLFSVCVQCFHSLGFLELISIYLYQEKNISYFEFYSALLEYILNNDSSEIAKLFDSFRYKLTDSLSGDWNCIDEAFGEVSWTFEEGAYLTALKNNDEAWAYLDKFLQPLFEDADFYNDIKLYQKNYVKRAGINNTTIVCHHDFLFYFTDALQGNRAPLTAEEVKYTFISDKCFNNWQDFAREIVWYGRRRQDTVYSNKPNKPLQIISERKELNQ